jgi:hypothetical protein
MIIIPTDATGMLREYTEQVQLEGVKYTVKLSWNTRTEGWYLSLYVVDADQTPVIQGVLVSCGVDLLRGSVVAEKPPGLLMAAPTDSSVERPGLKDLGARVQLYYRDSDE